VLKIIWFISISRDHVSSGDSFHLEFSIIASRLEAPESLNKAFSVIQSSLIEDGMLSDVLFENSADWIIRGKTALESKFANFISSATVNETSRFSINSKFGELHLVWSFKLEIACYPGHCKIVIYICKFKKIK